MPLYPVAHAITHEPGGSDDLYMDGGHGIATRLENFPRILASGSLTMISGNLILAMFTAPVNFTASNISFLSAGTQTAAGCTLCRFGLYTVDASGNSTLVAATANDTTLMAAQTTLYTKALSLAGDLATVQTSYTLIRGNRYALSLIWVGTTPPTVQDNNTSFKLTAMTPVMVGVRPAMADLQLSNTTVNAPSSSAYIYGFLT